MRNNHSEDKTSQSTEPQNTVPDVDVTAVFRPVGLPQTVTASAGFEAKYRLLDCQGDRTDHCDIIWGVRCALSGCLPTRSLRARHGDALRLDLPSFQQGVCEEIGIVIHSSANHVHLMLPGEFHELSTCRLVVAESDREIARMVQMLLEGDGFEVTVTHSAAAALERIERGKSDLALLRCGLARPVGVHPVCPAPCGSGHPKPTHRDMLRLARSWRPGRPEWRGRLPAETVRFPQPRRSPVGIPVPAAYGKNNPPRIKK